MSKKRLAGETVAECVFTNHKRNPNGTYGPTRKGHCYQPVSYHAQHAAPRPDKTRWCIDENHEYCVFVYADENEFFCTEHKCLFAIIDNGHVKLGKNGERIAKFPVPEGMTPYHGYPVRGESIGEALLKKWADLQIIEAHTRRRIARCQI